QRERHRPASIARHGRERSGHCHLSAGRPGGTRQGETEGRRCPVTPDARWNSTIGKLTSHAGYEGGSQEAPDLTLRTVVDGRETTILAARRHRPEEAGQAHRTHELLVRRIRARLRDRHRQKPRRPEVLDRIATLTANPESAQVVVEHERIDPAEQWKGA